MRSLICPGILDPSISRLATRRGAKDSGDRKHREPVHNHRLCFACTAHPRGLPADALRVPKC